jgi:Skp family chaperone for outer membrane proteins
MKKYVWIALSCLLACGSATAEERIVFVDFTQIFNGFYKTKLAQARISAQQKDIADERQVMVDALKAVGDNVDSLRKEARDITLSEEIRDGKRILYEERLNELLKKEKEIVDFDEQRKKQLQMQGTRMRLTIIDEIRKTIVDYAQQEGLSAVIDSSARGAVMPVFIYTHPDADITATILTTLNSKQPDLSGEDLLEDGSVDDQKPVDDGGEASEDNEAE